MPKKQIIGTVVSNKMTNTVTVAINRMKVHRLYHKRYQITKKFHADTKGQAYAIGDTVSLIQTKPISKMKHWVVGGKVEAANQR